MRIPAIILGLTSVLILVRVAWIALWDRASFYDVKYWNAVSTTSTNSVPLSTHIELIDAARRDANSLGLQVLLAIAIAIVAMITFKLSKDR